MKNGSLVSAICSLCPVLPGFDKLTHRLFCTLFLATCSLSLSAQVNPARIEIARDSFGVPHIFAPTDAEVAYGLAWAHCEDDFETIQTGFLAAKGLLGRVIGPEGAAIDFVGEFIRARELVEARFAQDISPEYLRVLEGYAAGFNRYGELHPEGLRHKDLLPITPKDMATYATLQMFVFTGGDGALQKLTENQLPQATFPSNTGSNAFAFNSRKTADGQTYLNINSHQPWEGIVAWYEAHLSSEEGWNILGGLFPGAPNILHGCNEYLGWAHTVNHPDKLDVYQLEMHPTEKLRYKFDNEWLTLEEEKIRLKVKIAGLNIGLRKKAWYSVYGPTMKNKSGFFSIRSSGLFTLGALDQWYHMNKARNFSEFHKALKMNAIPGFNVVYADRYDTIYYLCNARMPIRTPGYDWSGTVPGNTSRTLWTEFYPTDSLPQVLNPPSGYVFNTNNTPFHSTAPADNPDRRHYSSDMGYELYDNNRSTRFMELVAPYEIIDYERFKEIKYDGQLPAKLAFATNFDSLFSLDPQSYPELSPLIRSIQQWDRRSDLQNIGATHFVLTAYRIFDQKHLGLDDPYTVT
ncbi:MAG: acylase, partial [Bacteroidetes bacterium]